MTVTNVLSSSIKILENSKNYNNEVLQQVKEYTEDLISDMET
jgi:hypothetical protein